MAEIFYHLSDYADEVQVHVPTLEGAAYFLQHGRDPDGDPDDVWIGAPLAKPGDAVPLMRLEILLDTVARRDGASGGWVFDPPLPPEANFLAVRWGGGLGWSGERICDPRDIGANGDSVFFDELNDGDDVVEHVAVGVTSDVRASFSLDAVTGEPRLTLISQADSAGEGGADD